MLSERAGSPNSKKCVLIEDNDNLKDLNNYLPNLLTYLWENPKLVATLLSNSDIKDIKDNLASLIVNNFYENILSSNYIEDNLMYVFALMLKNEINNLENINKPELFLDKNSPCGYLLYELRRKNDIQYFFKTVILNAVDNLEVISSKSFNLNAQEIVNIFKNSNNNDSTDKENKANKTPMKKSSSIKPDDLYKKQLDLPNELNLNYEELKLKQNKEIEKAKFDEFSEKYLATLTVKEIKKMAEENNDKNMKDYFNNQIINCENINDDDFYSNSILMENLYQLKESEQVLYLYQSDFLKIIDFMEQILTNLKNNLYLLPYSVKCLCKIISILISKKFSSINETQKNAFIANFLFKQLLIPILENPGIGVLINNFISKDTLLNIKIINNILVKLVSGQFFRNNESESDYAPFNWYFLEKMPEILVIFEKISKVTLPHFIEDLLNDKLDENFQYDYFKENPDEIMFHRSICFNLHDISAILNNLDKCKDKIFIKDSQGLIFKKTFEKLYSAKNKKLLDNLKNNEDLETIQKEIKFRKSIKKDKDKDKEKEKINFENVRKKTNYFLLTSLIANDKYKELFDLQLEQNPNYTIKELKKTNNESDIKKNNIIKVKNFFSSLLYNYRKLIITDFDQGNTSNTVDILKILKTFIKSSNYVVDDSIPSEWYIDSLLDYLKIIPEELKNNDFEKLYDEIEEDLNLSIKKLDFETLSVCLDKLKFAKRGKNYYEESIKSTKELEINEKVQDIIDEFIPVEIIFKYNNEQKIFDIMKSKLKQKDLDKKHKQKKIINDSTCINIKSFTEKFPNLTIFEERQDIDIFDLQKELKIPDKLDFYFNYIKEYLISNKKIPSSFDIDEINNKIYDYVMSKLYDKIFPKTNDKDDKIFNKSFMLSWTEPKHFIQGKTNYVFDSFLPGVIDYFKLIDKEKSPRKKISYMKEIFNSISKVVKFNGGDENTGVDDQMPILNYAFVKAQPIRIYSNSKLMELYIGDMSSKEEGSQLMQLIALCEFIINLTYQNLHGVTKEEFTKKCNSAALGREASTEM